MILIGLNRILRNNYDMFMTKNVCFRLTRKRGIRISNQISIFFGGFSNDTSMKTESPFLNNININDRT